MVTHPFMQVQVLGLSRQQLNLSPPFSVSNPSTIYNAFSNTKPSIIRVNDYGRSISMENFCWLGQHSQCSFFVLEFLFFLKLGPPLQRDGLNTTGHSPHNENESSRHSIAWYAGPRQHSYCWFRVLWVSWLSASCKSHCTTPKALSVG